jgi:hypothetical protein
MSRVLVVSRTRMNQGRVCVGGHDLDDDFRSVRLLTSGGMNLKEEDAIAPSEIWELEYQPHTEPDPPHVEDVLVSKGKLVEKLPTEETARLILAHETPWSGGPEELFDGTVRGTPNGRVYVPGEGPLPNCSTGYWLPEDSLIKYISFDRPKFTYQGDSPLDEFTWAGMTDAPDEIEHGTLVRVSLARWYNPSSAPAGYYVQISDTY